MVAYLEKSTGSAGFYPIIDFLTRSHIHYALTKKPEVLIGDLKLDIKRVLSSNTEIFAQLALWDMILSIGRKFSNEGFKDDEGVHEKASTETELFMQEGSGKASDEISTAGKKKDTASEEVPPLSTARSTS
ncbi:hypothetical protein Tco_1498774 [Tanacetum coccineum]